MSVHSNGSPLNKAFEEDDFVAKHPSDVIGNWGPVQRRLVLFLCLLYFVAPFNNMGIVFWLAKQDFYCNFHNESAGSYDRLKNTCEFKGADGLSHTCSNFSYDTSVFKRTLVTEFDLVCGRSYLGSLAQSAHQVGYMVSGNLIGHVSDRHGRLFASQVSIILEIIAGFGQAFSPTIYWFIFARFFVGIAAYGRFLTSFVIVSEWIGPKYRSQAVILYEYGYGLASLLLPLAFWLNTDYYFMQTWTSIVECILYVCFLLIVWESPRWLLTHSKFAEAGDLMRKAAKARKTKRLTDDEIERRITSVVRYTEKQLEAEQKAHIQNKTFLDVWKVPELLKLSLILYWVWLTGSFLGYGTKFNIGSLGGSLFISFLISSLSSVVTNTLLLYFIDRFPRKKFILWMLFLVIVGLAGMFVFSFNDEHYAPRLAFYFLFNSARSASTKIYYLYTAESFPTTLRQQNIGTCSFFARIASSISPFVKVLAEATHVNVVLGLYLIMETIALILFSFVPETGCIQLPDTIGQKKKDVLDQRRLSRVSQASAS